MAKGKVNAALKANQFKKGGKAKAAKAPAKKSKKK